MPNAAQQQPEREYEPTGEHLSHQPDPELSLVTFATGRSDHDGLLAQQVDEALRAHYRSRIEADATPSPFARVSQNPARVAIVVDGCVKAFRRVEALIGVRERGKDELMLLNVGPTGHILSRAASSVASTQESARSEISGEGADGLGQLALGLTKLEKVLETLHQDWPDHPTQREQRIIAAKGFMRAAREHFHHALLPILQAQG